MAPVLSKDLRDRVVEWRIKNNWSYRKLAAQSVQLLIFSCTTVCNGTSTNPFWHHTGQPRLLDQEDYAYINTLLDWEPTIYLDEIQDKLMEDRDIDVSIASIRWAIVHLDFTRKAISKEAKERNELLRAIWEGNMTQYTDPDLFLFLDESAVNNLTTQWLAGWSRCGMPCVRRATFLRGTHYSILPVLTINGIEALDIFEGTINREKFLSFLHGQIVSSLAHIQWLEGIYYWLMKNYKAPILNPYLGKQSIVIVQYIMRRR